MGCVEARTVLVRIEVVMADTELIMTVFSMPRIYLCYRTGLVGAPSDSFMRNTGWCMAMNSGR